MTRAPHVLVLLGCAVFPAVGLAETALPGSADATLRSRCRRALSVVYRSADLGRTYTFVTVDGGVDVKIAAGGGRSGGRISGACTFGSMRIDEGTITLPPGWIAVGEPGVDSRPGRILDASDVKRLTYDLGPMAGTIVGTIGAEFDWYGAEQVAKRSLRYGTKGGEVRITLDAFNNFWGAAASRADAEKLVAIFRSLR